jgi:hypothetical protein
VPLLALLAAYPTARLPAGPVPLYFLDFIIAITLVASLRRGFSRDRFGVAVLVYLLVWLPTWLYQVVSLDVTLEPTYGLARNVLAVGCYFIAVALINSERTARRLLMVLAIGMVGTSVLALAQSLPGTDAVAREFIFSVSPTTAESSYRTYAERSFALFQAATTLAGFLAVMIVLLIAYTAEVRGWMRFLLWASVILGSLGLFATYSRQWVPAVLLGIAVVALLRPGRFGRALGLALVPAAVVYVALNLGALDQDYLGERFNRLGSQDSNVQVRLKRQNRFLELAAEGDPQSYLGVGFATQDLAERGVIDTATARRLRAGSNENSFLLEYFNHGFVAGILYLTLVLVAIGRAVVGARRPGPHQAILAALAGALVTAAALHLFDNYFNESLFMKAFLWILIGMAIGLSAKSREADPTPTPQS